MMTTQTMTATVPVVQLPRPHRTEIKYGLITIGLIAALVIFAHTTPGIIMEQWLNGLIQSFIAMGTLGVFIFAFIANAAYMVNIPYTVLMLLVAAATASFTDQLFLAVATGLGAALGASVSYLAVHKMAQKPAAQPTTDLSRLERLIRNHPRLAPAVIFLGAITPLPDDPIFIYLALKKYPLRKLALPLFTGKVIHTLTLIALLDVFAPGQLEIGFASLFPLLMLTLIYALYQAEKNRS